MLQVLPSPSCFEIMLFCSVVWLQCFDVCSKDHKYQLDIQAHKLSVHDAEGRVAAKLIMSNEWMD